MKRPDDNNIARITRDVFMPLTSNLSGRCNCDEHSSQRIDLYKVRNPHEIAYVEFFDMDQVVLIAHMTIKRPVNPPVIIPLGIT